MESLTTNQTVLPKNTSKGNFRYDINALRAIAIIGVLLFHYKIELFSGGFTGVDVFFVISGYLMSKIVISAISKGQFSYQDYLGRRAVRIIPALLFLIFCIATVGFFVFLPEEYWQGQKNALSSILFLSNILYWRTTNYFAPASDNNIFLHTWSLSVEWQFYLIYPFLLLLFNKVFKNKKVYISVFVLLTIALAGISFFGTTINQTASFYLLPTRAWEMMMGGVAFLSENQIKGSRWRKPAALIGYVTIFLCFFFFDHSMPWPGVYTILPIIATFLVIISKQNDFDVIKQSIPQFIGKISYSLYLWHWPVYVIAQYYGIQPSLPNAILFSVLSILLGYFSFTYIESIKFKEPKYILATMAVVFTISATSYFRVNEFLYKPTTVKIANYSKTHQKELDEQFSRDTCHIDSKLADYDKGRCLCFIEGKKNILLIGDSHLAQLSQSFKERLAKDNINVLQLTLSATLPTIEKTREREGDLRKLLDFLYKDFIPKNASKIDGVILSAHWAATKTLDEEVILKGITDAIQYLKNHNINTIVIGQNEAYTIPYSSIAAKMFEDSIDNKDYLDEYNYVLNNYLSKNLSPYYIDIINRNSFPALSPKVEPYMSDNNHVTKYGADLIVTKVLAHPVAKKFLASGLQNKILRTAKVNKRI